MIRTVPGDPYACLVCLHFSATRPAVREALLQVDATLTQAGTPQELRTRTQIALAEACNNIVEHAYGPHTARGDHAIRLDIGGDRAGLQITLRDFGRAMPDGVLPRGALPPIDPADAQSWPEGGFGWALLRKTTHALSVSRHRGQNILRFRLPRAEKPDTFEGNAM